jgi:hypothetical protein
MSGTIVRKLDCKLSAAAVNLENQEAFINCFNFFQQLVTAGHCTRIASQFGASGSGFNYHDVASPAGENAFAVWRYGPASTVGTFYVLLQWATASNFGTSPGNPGVANGVAGFDGVGIAIAAKADGSSPWNGGTANAGADAKGSNVWTGTGMHVLDRACSSHTTAGSFATNHENCLRVHRTPALNSAPRMHLVGDADQFAILHSESDNGNYACFTAGRYAPRAGITPDLPLFALAHYVSGGGVWASATTNPYGTAAGTGSSREGGILGRQSSTLVGVATLAEQADLMISTLQPNNQISPTECDAFLPLLCYLESGEGGHVGTLIDGNVIRYCFSPSNHELNADGSRARMGVSAANSLRYSLSWDGGAAPGVGSTRAGRTS